MRSRTIVPTVMAVLLALSLHAEPGRKRALLIGINDYSASKLAPVKGVKVARRDWSNLDGAVRDVEVMRDLIKAIHKFDDANITLLTDQEATRAAIMQALERLVAGTTSGDIVLFYYSGHGSQVRNSRAKEEDDGLDESVVPADSRRGANDIRDKELRYFFNRILDRGAQLTVVFDACHSGSGARGLDADAKYRAISPDLRDVADGADGPLPEERGALVLSAAPDFDLAYEMMAVEDNKIHGAFSWALARAMRDADPGEPAGDTFLRARARLHVERPAQEPVLAGRADARHRPLLGMRADRRNNQPVVAVESITRDGIYILQGGWATGLTVGSELRIAGDEDAKLEVIALDGISRARARIVVAPQQRLARLESGSLLEIVTWAAPPSPPLRVTIPRAPAEALASVLELRREAARRGIRWVEDPTETTPTHLIRWGNDMWELVVNGHTAGSGPRVLARVPEGSAVFVQLPASAQLAEAIGNVEGVQLVDAQSADYLLVGRFAGNVVEYAWLRPLVSSQDRERSPMPLRTSWLAAGDEEIAFDLRGDVLHLRRVYGWHELESPPGPGWHYRLAVRNVDDGTLVEDRMLIGDRQYQLVLCAKSDAPASDVYARFVHVFVIDSEGHSVLLFPRDFTGGVEHLLPLTATPAEPLAKPPAEIPLGGRASLVVKRPYGKDTFFLLTTDEPLPSLGSLEWHGTRGGNKPERMTALEELLSFAMSGTRGEDDPPIRTPPNWSIERIVFESVPPKESAP